MKIQKEFNWHNSSELLKPYSRLNIKLNNLILLDNLWPIVLKNRAKFWELDSVQGGIIFVKVKSSPARHELLLKEKEIIKELNKKFEKPWIKKILIK